MKIKIKIKIKSILMLAFAFTAILLASCNKENDNQTTGNDNQPQTPSEMIIGKWECVEENNYHWGTQGFKDPIVTVGTVWNFKDDETLILPDGVEVYNIIEKDKLQLRISNYDYNAGYGYYPYFDMTLTNNELTLYRRQFLAKREGSGNVFNVKFTKIQQ